jgi:hypothetical protein
MHKWRVKLQCTKCGHKWTRTTTDVDSADPPCPNCKKIQRSRGMDYSSNRAPANVGNNPRTNAVDHTAETVMQDYGMTDLRSDVRQGETMAPKLKPRLQSMADTMFAGGNRGGMMRGINTAKLARQAMAGNFAPNRVGGVDPVALMHQRRDKPPVRILNAPDNRGRK